MGGTGSLVTYNPFEDGFNFEKAANQVLDPLDLFGARSGEQSKQTSLNAVKNASEAQLLANRENIDFQKDLFEQQTKLQEPWRNAGKEALRRIEKTPDFTFTAQDFENFKDPAYEFRVKEGINALDRSAASRGRLLSGAQDKAVTRYGQDMASQEYGNAFNRALTKYNTNLNTDKSLAGVGQEATNQVQSSGNVMGQNVSGSILNKGDAIAKSNEEYANALVRANADAQSQKASTVGAGLGALAAFSDIRLKENLILIDVVGNINIYKWDWNKIAREMGINTETRGVIAQEVRINYPESVILDESGYFKVDYSKLDLGKYDV